jgi:hypothetical protein
MEKTLPLLVPWIFDGEGRCCGLNWEIRVTAIGDLGLLHLGILLVYYN